MSNIATPKIPYLHLNFAKVPKFYIKMPKMKPPIHVDT